MTSPSFEKGQAVVTSLRKRGVIKGTRADVRGDDALPGDENQYCVVLISDKLSPIGTEWVSNRRLKVDGSISIEQGLAILSDLDSKIKNAFYQNKEY